MNYQKFNPDLWNIRFNYEAIATVITTAENAMKVVGHFRTESDYIGLMYSSSEDWNHDLVKYDTSTDYSGMVFSFRARYEGVVSHFDDTVQQPSLLINYTGGDSKVVCLGLNGVKNSGSDSFLYDGLITLSNQWIDPVSISASWTKTEYEYSYVWDPVAEETIEIKTPIYLSGTGEEGVDFDMDYVNGELYTSESSSIPYQAKVNISYTYNTHEVFTLNFDELYQGTHIDNKVEVEPTGIKSILFPLIPEYYIESIYKMTGRSDVFNIELYDMVIEGGMLNEIISDQPKVPYRVAEGYDDEYDKNPKRLIESLRMLGYSGMLNLYIGASHFYDKWGQEGVQSSNEKDMVLDHTKGINKAFETWLHHLLQSMKINGFNDIVISVAMENLQMPEEWKQRMADGEPAQSGWQPPTSFYSVNSKDVKTFIDRITRECLDIVVEEGLRPILQLGESWYWWQEFKPGDVNMPYEGRPPCFYDEGTMSRFREDTGYELPLFYNSEVEMTDKNREVAEKLRDYLGEYTNFMKAIANDYSNSQFTTLFFPPSVLDGDRVPEIMRIVNSPFEYWKRPNLDFIQIEDYDWVTGEVPAHEDVFNQPWRDMDYDFSQQHYFAGFVLKPENAEREWKLIERAAQQALGRRYREVFIWAGTQIRRDSWTPKLNTYVSDAEKWLRVNMKQQD